MSVCKNLKKLLNENQTELAQPKVYKIYLFVLK